MSKPIFKTLWGESGAKEEVDSSKIALGWTAERPPFQWENWSQWRQDAFISHVNVRGIPAWDEETEYGVGVKSYVSGSNGEVYVSLAPSGGTYPARDPVLDSIKWKKAWLDSDGTIGIPKVVNLQTVLDSKVDKIDGKGLSDNNYTTVEKNKLGGIESNSQRNVPTNLTNSRTSTALTIESSTGTNSVVNGASTTLAGVMTSEDKVKLDGLPRGSGGLIPLSGGGTGASNAAGARLALQLGNTATHNYGTTANTVMMGNDSRVVGVAQQITDGLAGKADKTTSVSAGTGLSGGGDLNTNRTLSVLYGDKVGTAAQGNDARILAAATKIELASGLATKVNTTLSIGAGAGLSGGGNLTTNRSFSVNYGTTGGTAAEGNDSRIVNAASVTQLNSGLALKVDKTVGVLSGVGLTGGGSLASSRTLAVAYGTTAGTAAQGDDARILAAATKAELSSGLASKTDKTTSVVAGSGLLGGGNLSADRTLSVSYGDKAGTAAQGNDSRIVNGQVAFNRLNIGATADTARTALQLGNHVTHNYGTTNNSVARGNDPRFSQALTSGLGQSQTWVNVRGSRGNNVTYTNTTGKPIQVFFEGVDSGSSNLQYVIGGIGATWVDPYGGRNGRMQLSFVIPDRGTYRFNYGSNSVATWMELR